MSYSQPSARSYPQRSVYDYPPRRYRGYGDDGGDFTTSDVLTGPTSPTLADPGIAAAAAAAAAAACASAGGTMDDSGNCIPQADVPTPVQPSGGGGAPVVPISVLTTPSGSPGAAPSASLASTLTSGPTPWIIGGLLVVGLLAVASKKKKTQSASAR